MKITQYVREYARDQDTAEENAPAVGMAEKAKAFTERGSEMCRGNKPEGMDEHH